MDPSSRWLELVERPRHPSSVAEGAALIAAHRDRAHDPDATLTRLAELADSCPGRSLEDLREHLFGRLGFDGDRTRYHHERNSLLPEVLDRRRGLPILLSVVTVEVGRQLGVALDPVGMPGHFLVRGRDDPDVFLDPFHGGDLTDAEGAERLFRRSNGPRVPFDPAYLEPTPPLAVLARMLANLRATYTAAGERSQLRWVLELRLTLPDVPRTEVLDLAAVLGALGRFDEAADALEELAGAGAGAASTEAAQRALLLRARLN